MPRQNQQALSVGVIALILSMDLFEAVAELFFKKASVGTGIHSVSLSNLSPFLVHVLTGGWVWGGVALYLVNFFIWMTVLARADLSVAYPLVGASYIFATFLSVFILHEKVSTLGWMGILLIVAGVWCMVRSDRKGEQEIESRAPAGRGQ